MDPFMPSPRQEPMGECVRWWRGAGWGGPLFLKEPARILEWVAFPFSRGSSQPRDWTQVSHSAGEFFSSWATRETQEYWSGGLSLLQWILTTHELNWGLLLCIFPSPGDLPNPGIEPRSPTLQADSLPTELSGKPQRTFITITDGRWGIWLGLGYGSKNQWGRAWHSGTWCRTSMQPGDPGWDPEEILKLCWW